MIYVVIHSFRHRALSSQPPGHLGSSTHLPSRAAHYKRCSIAQSVAPSTVTVGIDPLPSHPMAPHLARVFALLTIVLTFLMGGCSATGVLNAVTTGNTYALSAGVA